MAKPDSDMNRRWIKLILATLLLNALIITAFVTSTPEKSPAFAWTTQLYRARFFISPVDDPAELAGLHENATAAANPECVACHGPMLDSKIGLHGIHLTSDLLPGLACHDCHKSISLAKRGNAIVVNWVDVGFCKSCHSAFPGLKPGATMKPGDFEVDCTTCHSGSLAFRHEKPYLSQVIAAQECKGCHGGRALRWTPQHEKPDWLRKHGPEALRAGTKSCLDCHAFGLKFCDSCHATKPPSHTPREAWLAKHPDSARADTRGCFTCHKADFCKTCHLNHEANWRSKHPGFVTARGTSTCEKCHSLSFCSYCHTGLPGSAKDSSSTTTGP
jgi:hypothetical protein